MFVQARNCEIYAAHFFRYTVNCTRKIILLLTLVLKFLAEEIELEEWTGGTQHTRAGLCESLEKRGPESIQDLVGLHAREETNKNYNIQ